MFEEEIKRYYEEKAKIYQTNKNPNEGQLRPSFSRLLNDCISPKGYSLIEEKNETTNEGKKIRCDGRLETKDSLIIGYWESKDTKDNLEEEIKKKRDKGYPFENILFEDSKTAILIQAGREVARTGINDDADIKNFGELLGRFISYDKETKRFRQELENFKEVIPKMAGEIKRLFWQATKDNEDFKKQLGILKKIFSESIREDISNWDIEEMVTQHILSEDIFNMIFNENDYLHNNSIALEIDKTIKTFLGEKKTMQEKLRAYYNNLINMSSRVREYGSKQDLLNYLYEDFLTAYNWKKADTDGVVYTPSRVVDFMIKTSEAILKKHFKKGVKDKNVEILDPATGTGTFVTAIMEHIHRTGGIDDLKYKYAHEIHANEVSILPYYVANLNIDAKYRELTGEHKEFENICFVDTLDNVVSKEMSGQETNLLRTVINDENTKRIKNQNEKKISLVIGNPPYNANQQNENDNNKNREYKHIDDRIKATFIKESNAQKTKMYDMYTRFYRWAMDRVKDDGVIAFITNRSFIDATGYDGFRRIVSRDFSHAYILDLKSDVRKNPKIAGTTHNVFGIQTGVAMMFLVKGKREAGKTYPPCEVRYHAMDDFMKKEDKLHWLYRKGHLFNEAIYLEKIDIDKKGNWLNQTDNDWDTLVPVCSKQTKLAKQNPNEAESSEVDALFKLYSLGVVTARDEWVYDWDEKRLQSKVKFFLEEYKKAFDISTKDKNWISIHNDLENSIKWTRQLKKDLINRKEYQFSQSAIRTSLYRPFILKHFYYKKELNEVQYQMPSIFPLNDADAPNRVVCFSGRPIFNALAIKYLPDLHFNGDSQSIPLYVYENAKKKENVTAFGLSLFKKTYPKSIVTNETVFAYVYAVFHYPPYRKKYATNLKQDLPRIPLYPDKFNHFVEIGQKLLDLHVDFEKCEPHPLKTVNVGKKGEPKAKLSVKKDDRSIVVIDENTELHGVPEAAYEYKVGNRSPIEWVFDQYKAKKSSDPTIAAKFNNYRFAEHKEEVVNLIRRLATLSLRTNELIKELEK